MSVWQRKLGVSLWGGRREDVGWKLGIKRQGARRIRSGVEGVGARNDGRSAAGR